jgi:hypothetical protein
MSARPAVNRRFAKAREEAAVSANAGSDNGANLRF